jgi:hypothetical protein
MAETGKATPATPEERARAAARKRADDLRGFFTHLGSYLAVGLFFFLINLATDAGNWWFFYPMLPWGAGLAIHGWNVLWNDRMFGEDWAERKAQEILAKERGTPRAAATPAPASATVSTPPASETEDILRESAILIDRMRSAARQIPKPDVRRETLAICASADQVLSAIADNPNEVTIARDFLNRYLTPAAAIVNDYSRLASRNIVSAQPTLEKVESHDLPLLARKLDDLYDRVHRGNLIDLEVAREMLSLDVADWRDEGTSARPTNLGRAEPTKNKAQ